MGKFSVTDTALLHADYHATLAQMRKTAPVYLIPEVGAYYVTRYADVKTVLLTPSVFSSTAVRTLLYSGALTGGMPAYQGRARAMVEVDQVIGSDPPEHGRLRNHINKPFMPARIAVYEQQVRAICRQLLDEAMSAPGDTIDLVNQLAVPMTLNSLAIFLGVEPHYFREFREWTIAFIRGISGQIPPEEFARTSREMSDYLWTLVEARRQHPQDDVVTAVAEASGNDPRYSEGDVMVTLIMLLTAGHETTTNLIGNSARLLSQSPDQYQLLRADRSLIAAAITEILRYDSPVSMQVRLTTEDTELSDVKIARGSLVMAGIGSANLDEQVFEEPEKFDILRENRNAIPFGHGIHFCIGSALAKLEGRVAIEEILNRFPELVPGNEPWAWHDSLIFRGPQSFHVRKPVA